MEEMKLNIIILLLGALILANIWYTGQILDTINYNEDRMGMMCGIVLGNE